MTPVSKTRLLTTSAIVGLSIIRLTSPAVAQEAFGIHNDQPERLVIDVAEDEVVEGDIIGVYADNGPVTVTNAGTIHGNGTDVGGIDSRPSGGIVIAQPDSVVTNSGDITGAANGVATSYFFSEDENGDDLPPEALAANTKVTNDGLIRGNQGSGVALVGGGQVVNSGTISGSSGNPASGAQGVGVLISQFPGAAGADLTGVSSITNTAGGLIEGQVFGAVLQGGGTVDNAGIIRSTGNPNPATPNVSPFGLILGATTEQTGRSATLNNSGTVSGFLGILAGGVLESATINNSGTINGLALAIIGQSTGSLTVDNGETGQILANGHAITSNDGKLTVDNEGLIRSVNQNGVNITTADAVIGNDGTIRGGLSGVATNVLQNAQGVIARAKNTVVENTGLIEGASGAGVSLVGGGSVVNSGTIRGLSGNNVNVNGTGVSLSEFSQAIGTDITGIGSVTNSEDGLIEGQMFGVAVQGGGTIDNAGTIRSMGNPNPATPNVSPFGVILNAVSGQTERIGTLNNSGTVSGFLGLLVGGVLETGVVNNDGLINGQGLGVVGQSTGELVVNNGVDGQILANGQAITSNEGSLTVDNAGLIRSAAQNGINITTADAVIVNSGTIEGAQYGIVTQVYQGGIGRAVGTQIDNSGTIRGVNNDGIRLAGGGSVTNSGLIEGVNPGVQGTDGISMFAHVDQPKEAFSASVVNLAGGNIAGQRFGIILSGGGTVENAGNVVGVDGGMFLQGTAINTDPGEDRSGLTASVVNSGTISGSRADLNGYGVGFGSDLSTASLENSGTIVSLHAAGVFHGTLGDVTIANTSAGTIEGAAYGIYADGEGKLSVVNAGTIRSEATGVESTTQTSLTNRGSIVGGNGVAVLLGAFDDIVTLGTGSAVTGLIDAGGGADSLILDGDVLELTTAQQITATSGFEALDVAAGYWSTSGVVGAFDSVTIAEGGALQVNEVDLGGGETDSPILTSAVRTNGLLVLNFGTDETVSALDDLTIDGAGQLQLIGEAIFTVDTANIAHTGGTTISNGGLVLTGLLQGDVKTEGNGFFELGAGGTEGSFAGNIVNDGRFVFNRSDDYDFIGAFSGSGVLDKKGDGALVFLGDYAFQGVTNILGGSVRIGGTIDPATEFDLGEGGTLDITGKDQTIGGLEGDEGSNVVIGESQLTVDQSGNTAFGGNVSGTGSLVKDGSGTLNLTGDSSYTGPTSVNGGTLAVNGSITSPVTVNSGGTLGGNGSVGSTTVADGGRIAPGNSIGQLTVDGDLAFAAGSTYEVEANAAGAADRLDATGAVTIAGTAGVAVLAENGTYNPRTDYVILTGAGGITGTFGSVTSNLAFLNPLLRYGANSVTLSLYRNDIDFADVAVGFNQASVATAVQALGADNPLYEAVLAQNAATAQASFGDLSGEILASTISGLTDDSRHLRNALMGMQAPEDGGAFVWGAAFGGWGKFDAKAGNFAMDTDHKGLVAGVGIGGNGFAAALSAGIGSSDFHFGGRNDRADVESKYLAAHATYGTAGGLRGTIGVSYAWHDLDTTRAIGVAPLAQTLSTKRDADTLQIFGEIGYDIVTGNTAITPFARLAHVDTGSDAFAEAGGNAALVVGKADQKTTFFSLGARAQFNAGKPGFQPYISAAWNRAFDDRGAPIVSRFVTSGPTFDITGTAIPKNSAEVEAGFEFTTGNFRLGAAYTGALASDRNTHGARVTARIAF
ncbi:autotransporter domain-containing protein [Sphingopyxis fribergensis]